MITDDNCRGKGNVVANVNVRAVRSMSMTMWYQQTWWSTAKNECQKLENVDLWKTLSFFMFFANSFLSVNFYQSA